MTLITKNMLTLFDSHLEFLITTIFLSTHFYKPFRLVKSLKNVIIMFIFIF